MKIANRICKFAKFNSYYVFPSGMMQEIYYPFFIDKIPIFKKIDYTSFLLPIILLLVRVLR